MLDYKDVIIKHYVLEMSGSEIARQLNASKSGVNDFLRAFKKCETLSFPLPEGITNYGIAEHVYGSLPGSGGRDLSYEFPDFQEIARMMDTRKNMTLVFLWNRYKKRCLDEEKKCYQYRQFCDLYNQWCEENYETFHFSAVIGQKMEVDFAGKTFEMTDSLTGEIIVIVVFVAVLPYSQYIYAEGMVSTKEPQWIEVNNNAIRYFGGVPALVVCDNCKQAVLTNKDWIEPELNKDYAEWAEHNHTAILPAKVRKPKFKSSVENAVGILEKGFFHDLEERQYFSLGQFNRDLLEKLYKLNREPFKKKEHDRYYYWEEERQELMPLPSTQYQYMERRTAKVSSDFHVRYDNAYYSVDKAFLHKKVSIRATASTVKIFSLEGKFISEWPRAVRKGQWSTNPDHLPADYKNFPEWNATYFIKKAMTVGPNTVDVIRRILASRKLEVQTYRMCLGVLSFTKKYSRQALEECCKQALSLNKVTYTFIKNSIPVVAEDMGSSGYNTKINEERNQGGFIMSSEAMDINNLLSRSQKLAQKPGKEDEDNDLGLPNMAATLDTLYHSEKFLNMDHLTLISELIEPEYRDKISKRINNRLRSSHLIGCPQELSKCTDSKDREYLPSGITGVLSSMDFIESGLNICILGPSDSGKSYLAKALGIRACDNYRIEYHHCETFLEEMVALKLRDYQKYQRKTKKQLNLDLLILDDFLLHTITDEREVKVLFEILEK